MSKYQDRQKFFNFSHYLDSIVAFSIKPVHTWVCIIEKTSMTMQEKTLALLKQDIMTHWKDLENGDFENDNFLKELNACIGYYNQYKRGQIVTDTKE